MKHNFKKAEKGRKTDINLRKKRGEAKKKFVRQEAIFYLKIDLKYVGYKLLIIFTSSSFFLLLVLPPPCSSSFATTYFFLFGLHNKCNNYCYLKDTREKKKQKTDGKKITQKRWKVVLKKPKKKLFWFVSVNKSSNASNI